MPIFYYFDHCAATFDFVIVAVVSFSPHARKFQCKMLHLSYKNNKSRQRDFTLTLGSTSTTDGQGHKECFSPWMEKEESGEVVTTVS